MTVNDASFSPPSDELNSSALEATISRLEETGCLQDARHGHSLEAVSFSMPTKCVVCLGIIGAFGNFGSSRPLKCLVCRNMVHRTCQHEMKPCQGPILQQSIRKQQEQEFLEELHLQEDAQTQTDTTISWGEPKDTTKDSMDSHSKFETADPTNPTSTNNLTNPTNPTTTATTTTKNTPHTLEMFEQDNVASGQESSVSSDDDMDEPESPRHPTPVLTSTFAVTTVNLPVCQDQQATHSRNNDNNDPEQQQEDDDVVQIVQPWHQAKHPFASVSKALQENIMAHLQHNATPTSISKPTSESSSELTTQVEADPEKTPDRDTTDPAAPQETTSPQNPILQFANDTLQSVRSSFLSAPASVWQQPNNRAKLGAAFCGGIVGGAAAGLLVAGPAGAVAGCMGQVAAGALGVILEGSVSIGVVVAGVATGANTASLWQEKIMSTKDGRILTMGEEGISRKVLLVRPSIQTDPIWEFIVQEARQNAPQRSIVSFPGTGTGNNASATEKRYRRDSDILQADEDELLVNEKVLLLTSRILNDSQSLPGYIYRFLLSKFRERCDTRQALLDRHQDAVNGSVVAFSIRARRDDAHAVIKYVTATLLEVRPSFSSSSSITEMVATAVESLVFGVLYDLVMEEVIQEITERDEALLEKIHKFEQEGWVKDEDIICQEAIDVLHLLPTAHSAADKLRYCVRFLELISDYFQHRVSINTDSLLKMVCQHIVAAKLPRINAEVAFLEEFARDEQLLRGREGYSLATLQASLHFLNMCQDIECDIFEQDDDEENILIDGTT